MRGGGFQQNVSVGGSAIVKFEGNATTVKQVAEAQTNADLGKHRLRRRRSKE